MFKKITTLFFLSVFVCSNSIAACASYTSIISNGSQSVVKNAFVDSYKTGKETFTLYLSSVEYPYNTALTCKALQYAISYDGQPIDNNHRDHLIKAAILSQTLGYKLDITVGPNLPSVVMYGTATVTIMKP